MPDTNHKPLPRILLWWTNTVSRRAPRVILLMLLLSGLGLHYTISHLGIDTDTKKMFSEDLPFRRAHIDYQQAFPQYVDFLLVVVDADTPDLAVDASNALAAHLARRTDFFRSVVLPHGGPFFHRHGLLYLSIEELEDLTDHLARVQPLLAKLSQDQTLRGLFSILTTVLEALPDEATDIDLNSLFQHITEGLNATLQRRQYQLSWQELLLGRRATVTERRRFIILQPRLDFKSLEPAGPMMATVRELAEELQLNPAHGVRVRITGEPALAYEELQTVSHGTEITAMAALVTVTATLFIGLGSWQLVVITLIVLLTGLILTAGFATVAVGHVNLISIAFAVLYIGLGVDYALHFCLRYRELRQQRGLTHPSALQDTVRSVGGALVLCATTTAIGFYAFVPTDFDGVSELGLIAGTGMFISLLTSLTLLPALLTLIPPRIHPSPGNRKIGPWLSAATLLPAKHPRIVMGMTLLAGLVALALIPRARFDFNPLNLRDPATESVQTFRDLQADGNTSPWRIVVLAESETAAKAMANRLETLAEVEEALILQDFLPRDQDGKLALLEDTALIVGEIGNPGTSRPSTVSEQIEALREFLRTLESFLENDSANANMPALESAASALGASLRRFLDVIAAQSEPEETLRRLENSLLAALPARLASLRTALTADYVDLDGLPRDFVELWVSPQGVHRIEVLPAGRLDDNRALRRFVAAVQTIAPRSTEVAVIYVEAGKSAVRAFGEAFGYALAAITLILLVLIPRKRDVLLVLAPLLLAGALTVATAVVLQVPFNFANVIALPLLLGIGIDSGIHMVHRYRHAPPHHGNLLQTSTARAVLFSALTTLCSFGNLALSPHPGTASMGLLLSIGIAMTLVCTLIVLPALLRGWGGNSDIRAD